jgi:hypothetical protein
MDANLPLETQDLAEEVVDCVIDCVEETVIAIETKEGFWKCFKRWIVRVIKKCLPKPAPAETP